MIGDLETEVPDLPAPIEAWRCWHLDGLGLLRSPLRHSMWPPVGGWPSGSQRSGQRSYVQARCAWVDHPCPSLEAHETTPGCGLYAYKDLGGLGFDFPLTGMSKRIPQTRDLVWGKVLLWGKVYEHKRGYRAEFAQVSSLLHVESLGDHSREKLQSVADFYGVPLETWEEDRVEEVQEAVARRTAEVLSDLSASMTAVIDVYVNRFTQAMESMAESLNKLMTTIKNRREDPHGDDR